MKTLRNLNVTGSNVGPEWLTWPTVWRDAQRVLAQSLPNPKNVPLESLSASKSGLSGDVAGLQTVLANLEKLEMADNAWSNARRLVESLDNGQLDIASFFSQLTFPSPSDLVGVKSLANLTALDISRNIFDGNFDFAAHPKLEKLNISSNLITNAMDFNQIASIKAIDISKNYLNATIVQTFPKGLEVFLARKFFPFHLKLHILLSCTALFFSISLSPPLSIFFMRTLLTSSFLFNLSRPGENFINGSIPSLEDYPHLKVFDVRENILKADWFLPCLDRNAAKKNNYQALVVDANDQYSSLDDLSELLLGPGEEVELIAINELWVDANFQGAADRVPKSRSGPFNISRYSLSLCKPGNREDTGKYYSFEPRASVMGWYDASTGYPTSLPSMRPTQCPSSMPTQLPSAIPSYAPTDSPSLVPTSLPSNIAPVENPTSLPSIQPTCSPSSQPSSSIPSVQPTVMPTIVPGNPTRQPTVRPTFAPSGCPSSQPTSSLPSGQPTANPSPKPTFAPTVSMAPTPTTESDWEGLLSTSSTQLNSAAANDPTASALDIVESLVYRQAEVMGTSQRRLQTGTTSTSCDNWKAYITSSLGTATSSYKGSFTCSTILYHHPLSLRFARTYPSTADLYLTSFLPSSHSPPHPSPPFHPSPPSPSIRLRFARPLNWNE
jgi:hypothetical protein